VFHIARVEFEKHKLKMVVKVWRNYCWLDC